MYLDEHNNICIKHFEDDEGFEWVSVTEDGQEPLFDIKTADGHFCETLDEALAALHEQGWTKNGEYGECWLLVRNR